MYGISQGMYFFLLEEQVKYFRDDNPKDARTFILLFGGIALVALLIHLIRTGVSTSVAGKSKGRKQVTPRKFNAFTLYRIASVYGLDKEQTKLLEYIFRLDSVADPERVMSNPALLDRHFKHAFKNIEKNSETEDDAQERLVRLFTLRNLIESASSPSGTTAARVTENTPAVLSLEQESYPVKVISARAEQVITEIPRNSLGTPIRISKGARVTLSFFTKSSKGFSFDGHVMGVLETDRGQGLQISHTGKIKSLVKRAYRRKQAAIKCEFFGVYLDASDGKKKAPKMVVDSKKLTGTVLDISIGGCALKTMAQIPAGSRLKIVIDFNDNYLINVLGQVLRINRSGAAGTILHIKFLKVPRRAFNSISALVFGYDEE